MTYSYDPAHPHAVRSLSNGNSYGYDENGNMILRNVDNQVFELAYDAENRLVSVSPGSLGMNPPLPPGGGSGSALSLSKWVRVDSLPRSGGGQGGGHLVSYNPQALLQSGFPSTPALDHFNRMENPLSTNWESPLAGALQANGSTAVSARVRCNSASRLSEKSI